MKLLYVSVIIVILDQVSKFFVKGLSIPFINFHIPGMYYGQRIPLIGDLFNITFVENPGIAFGIDFGSDLKLLISFFTIAATGGLIIYFYMIRKKNFNLRLSIAIIIGGAIGNLIDRIFYGVIYGYAPLLYGKVVDFFDFRMFSLYFFHKSFGNYIFNVADIAVTAGVIMLLFNFHKREAKNPEADMSLSTAGQVEKKYLAENKD